MSHRIALPFMSVCLMLVTILLANFDNRLFPSQMMKHHAKRGFPAVSNGALWGNIFLMPFVFYLVGGYFTQWTLGDREIALVIGVVVAFYMFKVVYKNGRFDDAWAGAGQMHPAGLAAMVYSALLFSNLILFYVFSSAKLVDIWMVGTLLLLYIPLANHYVLNALNKRLDFAWCPRVFVEEERPLKILLRGSVVASVISTAKLLFPGAWW